MNISLVIITPASHRAAADAAMASLGWGETNFLVELGPEATGSPTHFGLRATVPPEFMTALQAEFAAFGGDVQIDTAPDADRVAHFDSVLDAQGLHRIMPLYID